MKLVVLGANGYRPSDLGHTSCYAIPELGVVLDAGTRMYRMADYLETESLDVYLTHSHRDHTWGLVYLEFLCWRRKAREDKIREGGARLESVFFSLADSAPRVRIHAHEEHLKDVVEQVKGSRDYGLMEFVPLEASEQLLDGARLTSFPVQHREGELCFGFRIDWQGRSLAYVTDTYGTPGAGYVEQIRGADLLLHDCYMTDSEPELARRIGHSHATPVAQLAAEAGVGRLVLVHLNALRPEAGEPDLDHAKAIFPETLVAFDGLEIEF